MSKNGKSGVSWLPWILLVYAYLLGPSPSCPTCHGDDLHWVRIAWLWWIAPLGHLITTRWSEHNVGHPPSPLLFFLPFGLLRQVVFDCALPMHCCIYLRVPDYYLYMHTCLGHHRLAQPATGTTCIGYASPDCDGLLLLGTSLQLSEANTM